MQYIHVMYLLMALHYTVCSAQDDMHLYENAACENSMGVRGTCVYKEQCDSSGHYIEDGRNNIDVRADTYTIDCPYEFTCCTPSQSHTSAERRIGRDKSKECGWTRNVNSNTIGQAGNGEVPWMAGIMYHSSTMNGNILFEPLGNGALIHERVTLTSANVLKNHTTNLGVVVGDHDQTRNDPNRKVIIVVEVVVHPEFNYRTAHNNLALLFLNSAWSPQYSVSHACLPLTSISLPDSTRCFFTGWGLNATGDYHSTLTKTEVTVTSRSRCEQFHRLTPFGPFYKLIGGTLCAGGQDTCTGAGGSPLMCPVEGETGRYFLAGILSFTWSCKIIDIPTVFTDVARYRSWIDETLATEGYNTTASNY